MGVALVTKCVPAVTAEEGEGKCISRLYSNKRRYKRCTLLTRRSAVFAVDVMHGRGPSSKMRPQLQPKKTKVRLNYPFI